MLRLSDEVMSVVDLNPNKDWKFIPVTAQEIVPPEFLKGYKPDVIIAMNQNYITEIESLLISFGLKTALVCA